MNGQLAFRAAEIMAERGHCKNRLFDGEGRVCYIGALHYAIRELGSDSYNDVTGMSAKILAERGYGPSGVYGWGGAALPIEYNNDPVTTGEDVIMLLKESGARLEAQ